jgi:cyclomaltodextrinase / maltogenic alpha-amylase / neopullulanase
MPELSATPAWVADAVFYQIFPDRFALSTRVQKPGPLEPWDSRPTTFGFKGGDLLGIVEHLDYLTDLGVTALYLTPIFSSASNHRYHTYDYYQVDPLLGGDAALRELLDACHARGMRVVLDGVFNHSGRGFWPFHHVAETGASSPYVEWFYMDRAALARGKQLRPYPTPQEEREMARAAGAHRQGDVTLNHLGYRAWWDLPALPKLNTNNPFMREHLMGAVEHWLRFGIDGWRLDVAEEIDAGFWREFRQRVRGINPEAYIVAEIWHERPQWVTGDTFDALMNYPLTEALLSFTAADQLDTDVISTQHEYRDSIRPIDGPRFARDLQRILTSYRPEATRAQLNLLGSHDTPRFVTCASGDQAALRLSLLAVMTLPGAPCIYYGDEVGVEGRHDPDNRGSFPWDEERWDHDLLAFVRCTTSLRAEYAYLRDDAFRILAAEGQAVAYARGGSAGGEGALVVLNAAGSGATLRVRSDFDGLSPVELPGWTPPRTQRVDGGIAIDIGPRTGGMIRFGGSTQ